jgi:hypothetical protein
MASKNVKICRGQRAGSSGLSAQGKSGRRRGTLRETKISLSKMLFVVTQSYTEKSQSFTEVTTRRISVNLCGSSDFLCVSS